MLLVEVKYDVAQEDQRADEIGIATAGFILEQAGVLAPMVADFHAGPVIADRL